ncbi:MAG: Rnf-Nqr domain containing protein [Bacilli bacterium]|nr:Rnf-Nqr domain containing protein [Bacilli bacterium]MDD4808492.1 Rnf-Nqr domain containing protein [Bacilli bacterium]
MSPISIFVTSVLAQNIILTKFLGICPFIGASNKEKNAFHMGLSVMLVITLSSIITYVIYHFVLVPTNTTYLRTTMFVLVIASMVQLMELFLKKYLPGIHKTMGLYLPLIATNCAVLGVTLLNINNDFNFLQMLAFSVGSSLGYLLIIYIFATIRERLETSDISKSFDGIPIALLTAAIMSLVFVRYL